MTWVFAAGVLFGVFHLCFDASTAVSSKMILALASWAVVIVLFVATGQLTKVVEYAVFIVSGLILIALLLPPITYSCRTIPRCNSNLGQIAAAMVSYEMHYDCLPPPYIADGHGNRMHSWRVLILPYLGEQNLYDQYRFDEPWNGPNNRKLHDQVVDPYRCPSDHAGRSSQSAADTSYVVITGPGTVFPGGRRKISIADVATGDGSSNTLLVVEIRGSGIHWMEPRDLELGTMDFQINGTNGKSLSSKHPDGVMVAMVDGSVRFLDEKIPQRVVRQLITYKDGQPLPKNLGVKRED